MKHHVLGCLSWLFNSTVPVELKSIFFASVFVENSTCKYQLIMTGLLLLSWENYLVIRNRENSVQEKFYLCTKKWKKGTLALIISLFEL